MITIPMTVAATVTEIPVGVAADQVSLAVGIGASFSMVNAQAYEGPYEFTPSQETQTAQTNGYLMEDDITINPIPNNYGLITWNGSVLTVS